mmetsp:Transcript_70558/g.169052  ORF Transcript_70558/g.169052 Transcript_70558/m.169052 type:complete len:377 (+) Transcript_70558:108-1238(+)
MAPKADLGTAALGAAAVASLKMRKARAQSAVQSRSEPPGSAGTMASVTSSPRSVSSVTSRGAPKRRQARGLKAAVTSLRVGGALAKTRRMAAEKSEGPPPYDGPRPDEELLTAVHREVTINRSQLPATVARSDEDASIEDIYWKLRRGEDVNQRQVHGFTSLAVASSAGHVPLLSLLMDRDADVTMPSIHRNETPLHHACRFGRLAAATLLLKPAHNSCGLDAPNAAGWTPLHIAVENGDLQMMRVLLEGGASPEARNTTFGGDRPIHIALRRQDIAALELLLEHGAKVDVANAAGMTPLHIAASAANYPCVSLLVRSRGDAARKDSSGRNALQCIPKGKPSSDKVILLLQAYARPPHPGLRSDARFEKDFAYQTL